MKKEYDSYLVLSEENTLESYHFIGPVKGLTDRIKKKATVYYLICNMDEDEHYIEAYYNETEANRQAKWLNNLIKKSPALVGYNYYVKKVTI